MNGKDIDTHIVYDDDRVWSLELSSGMERFISSLGYSYWIDECK